MCARHGPGPCHVEAKIESVYQDFVRDEFTILDGVEVGVNIALRALCSMKASKERDAILEEAINLMKINYEKYKANEHGGSLN